MMMMLRTDHRLTVCCSACYTVITINELNEPSR